MAFILDLCLCDSLIAFFLGIFFFIAMGKVKKISDFYAQYIFLTAVVLVITGIVFALISVIVFWCAK